MESPLFEERQSLRWPYLLVVGALVMVALYLTSVNPSAREADAVMVPLTVAIGLVAAVGFTTMQTVLTAEELRFGFPLWRKRVPVEKIEVGCIEPLKLWYGIGIHYLGDKWVYNVHLGEAVRITVDGQSYLIGSREPEQLQHTLLRLSKSRIWADEELAEAEG